MLLFVLIGIVWFRLEIIFCVIELENFVFSGLLIVIVGLLSFNEFELLNVVIVVIFLLLILRIVKLFYLFVFSNFVLDFLLFVKVIFNLFVLVIM